MKKYIFLIALLLLFASLLSSCSKTEIKCGIDRDCTSYLSYGFEADFSALVDTDRAEVKRGMESIVEYYQKIDGAKVEQDIFVSDKNSVKISIVIARPAKDVNRAADKLHDLLYDEKITPFTEVNATSKNGKYQTGYVIRGIFNPEKILATAGIDKFPDSIKNIISDGISQSSMSFSVTLPATEVIEHTGELTQENGFATVTYNTSLTQQLDISLVTRAVFNENGDIVSLQDEGKIEERINRRGELLTTISYAAGVVFILCLAGAVVFAVKSKLKHNRDFEK